MLQCYRHEYWQEKVNSYICLVQLVERNTQKIQVQLRLDMRLQFPFNFLSFRVE